MVLSTQQALRTGEERELQFLPCPVCGRQIAEEGRDTHKLHKGKQEMSVPWCQVGTLCPLLYVCGMVSKTDGAYIRG